MGSLGCAAPSTPASRSEEGLEQDFNSLHAQREACEAYVAQPEPRGLGRC